MIVNVYWSSCKVSDFLDIIMKVDFSRQELHVIPFSGSPVFPCRRTNRQNEANSHFSQKLRTRLRSVILFKFLMQLYLS